MSRGPFLATALALLAGCGRGPAVDPARQIGRNPLLPPPHEALLPDFKVPKPIGWKAGEAPKVPAGFAVRPLVAGIKSPRTVHVLANGDVLVVQSTKAAPEPVDRAKSIAFGFAFGFAHGDSKGETNRVLLVRDADGDGKPELVKVLLRGLNSPFGLAQRGGDLFVAATDAVWRYPFVPGDTAVRGPGDKLLDLPAGPINHHWTKDLALSPDGRRLYVGVGSNSNVRERGVEAETGRAAIWEVDVASGAHRLFADGLRNPNGLAFVPGSNILWTVVNERDELGSSLVPDYMTSVRGGGFYGWPYSYYGRHVDPRVRPQRPDLVAKAISPDYALGPHVAPLGLAFTGNGAFVGEHGSWNRRELNGYRVVFIRFVGGRPVGKPVTFVSGFVTAKGQARGRPVGVAIDKSGALLIADDVGDTVWRVSPVRRRPAPP